MIQAITFDLWNTLFINRFYSNLRLNSFTQFLERKRIPFSFRKVKSAFNMAFFLPERNYEENDHIYTEDRIFKMIKMLDLDLSKPDKDLIKKEFEEVMLKDPPPLKSGVKQTLEELSSDYKIGLISNTGVTPGRIISRVFQEYEILKYFHVMVFSDEIGYYKPHPTLFKIALRELNCVPQNVIHIGDKLETDIKGAKDCNMNTIWFNECNSPKSEIIQPNYEINKIPEVIQIIKGFS